MCKKLTHLGMGPRRRGSPQSFGLFRGSILGAGFRCYPQLFRKIILAQQVDVGYFCPTPKKD